MPTVKPEEMLTHFPVRDVTGTEYGGELLVLKEKYNTPAACYICHTWDGDNPLPYVSDCRIHTDHLIKVGEFYYVIPTMGIIEHESCKQVLLSCPPIQ